MRRDARPSHVPLASLSRTRRVASPPDAAHATTTPRAHARAVPIGGRKPNARASTLAPPTTRATTYAHAHDTADATHRFLMTRESFLSSVGRVTANKHAT